MPSQLVLYTAIENGCSEESGNKRYMSGQNQTETIPLLPFLSFNPPSSFVKALKTRITLIYYAPPAPSPTSPSVALQYSPPEHPFPLDLL